MAVIGINYIEGKPETYESVYIHLNEGEKIFNSGDFIKDWFQCNNVLVQLSWSGKEISFSNSSTVDHFIMDGAKFDSAYLKIDSDLWYLDYKYDANSPGFEFFVKRGTKPTWEELKKHCKN